jgi:hypothetical protein
MKNVNVKAFTWILLLVSITVWIAVMLVSGNELKFGWKAITKLPTVVTVDLLLWIGFSKWFWKWRIFQGWLVPFPVLQGTWQGTLISTWANPATGQLAGEIPMVLVIKQSFTTISCTIHTYTRESHSRSYAANFLLDDESGLKQLIYTYTNKPKPSVRDRSPVHDGTALLEILKRPRRMLRGEYWTNRRTTGDIELHFRCKQLLEKFPDDLKPD